MDGLYFANGVALSSDESFVLVSETYRYRIQRYWLRGPRAGRSDIFIDNLPGFPDGVSSNRQGTFWVAMATPRKSLVDAMHPYPFLKNALAKLPRSLWPKPVRYGLVLGLGEDGQVAFSLHDPGGERVHMVTSVEQRGDHLYLGSLTNDRIARVPVPEGI
jgi:sugar lactone lactonase YvrE